MEISSPAKYKTVRIRCPQCLNYMDATSDGKETFKGCCPHCKSVVFEQRHSRERIIRIRQQS